jgi:cyclohexanecarboxyl-CoA dehydrogenase
MDFGLSPDQKSVRDAVRAFARAELAPGYRARAKSAEFPWKEHRRVAALGVFGLLAGPEHNPLGAEDYLAAGLAVEELGYADFNLANAAIPVMLMSSLIARHGGPAVRQRWLEPMIDGTAFVGLALTEPEAGSDVSAIRTTATATSTADGDGYVLRGEKTSVTMLAHAHALVVVAKTVRDGQPVGASAFVVPMDLPGVSRFPVADPGWLPLGRGMLHLDDVRVPASARLGEEGSAFRSVLGGFDFTRPLLTLTGVGCAQAAIEETAGYLTKRQVFGSPLAGFEGASFLLAEHATHLEAARLLCYSTLWRRSSGLPHTDLAAMAKWYGPLHAGQAIRDCLLLHGNVGYSAELPFEQRLRDVLALEIADGTAQIQKIIIARELFGPEFVPYRRSRRQS